jgi:hypothetical protein
MDFLKCVTRKDQILKYFKLDYSFPSANAVSEVAEILKMWLKKEATLFLETGVPSLFRFNAKTLFLLTGVKLCRSAH